jgi:hypothetical protein
VQAAVERSLFPSKQGGKPSSKGYIEAVAGGRLTGREAATYNLSQHRVLLDLASGVRGITV